MNQSAWTFGSVESMKKVEDAADDPDHGVDDPRRQAADDDLEAGGGDVADEAGDLVDRPADRVGKADTEDHEAGSPSMRVNPSSASSKGSAPHGWS